MACPPFTCVWSETVGRCVRCGTPAPGPRKPYIPRPTERELDLALRARPERCSGCQQLPGYCECEDYS